MATAFDCSIDLTKHHPVPADLAPSQAAELVRAAIEALPGARWVSVEWCGDTPPDLPWLRVYALGDGREQSGGVWSELADSLRMIVHRTLSTASGT
jgi:hypothetical protein